MSLIKKKICFNENIKILKSSLNFQNFGNASCRVKENFITIKPSGINVLSTEAKYYPLIRISDGKVFSKKLRPSVDTNLHLEIYRNFKDIESIVHTHSKYATIWAQACKKIPIYGTTHADYWDNDIPVTKKLNLKEVQSNYERNIGKSVVQILKKKYLPGMLIAEHGVISFGKNSTEAFLNAERLEYVAELAFKTQFLTKKRIRGFLIKKHYERKNGGKKYYGQKKS
jgi:L-ribulose-5-phosphate 4-epimerase